MKQYMLSVYHADRGPALAPEVMAASIRDVDALNAEMMTAALSPRTGIRSRNGLIPTLALVPGTWSTLSIR